MHPDYKIDSFQLNTPAEPEAWYWTLSFKGVRINGGIADSEYMAKSFANSARNSHNHRRWQESMFYDAETKRWLPKTELGI